VSTDEDQTLCRFLVLLNTGGNNIHPVFVMAKTFQHARLEAMAKVRYLEGAPNLSMTVHVFGEAEIAAVMPDVREVAWKYFAEGAALYAQESLDSEGAQGRLREEFDVLWSREGVSTEPA
jgi:hypothetical protein